MPAPCPARPRRPSPRSRLFRTAGPGAGRRRAARPRYPPGRSYAGPQRGLALAHDKVGRPVILEGTPEQLAPRAGEFSDSPRSLVAAGKTADPDRRRGRGQRLARAKVADLAILRQLAGVGAGKELVKAREVLEAHYAKVSRGPGPSVVSAATGCAGRRGGSLSVFSPWAGLERDHRQRSARRHGRVRRAVHQHLDPGVSLPFDLALGIASRRSACRPPRRCWPSPRTRLRCCSLAICTASRCR